MLFTMVQTPFRAARYHGRMDEDFYKILGLSRNATADDIQKAYRKLARKYHPDINPDKNAKFKFQQIQRAYDVLNDPEKRELYDRYGSSFESSGAGPGPGGGAWRTYSSGPGGFEGFDFGNVFGGEGRSEGPFADFFQQFAGAGEGRPRRGAGRSRRGADLQHELTIPFHTAVTGGEARLHVRRPDGREETIAVKIPPGVDEGQTIRLRGQGDAGPRGGAPGDLLIAIHVAPHPCYRRRGLDLEVQVPVTVAEAALGTKVDIPSPHGVISVKIPPGTSSGKRLRVRGQGIAKRNGKTGDLYAEILITLPPQLDSAATELIRKLDALHPHQPRAELQW
jgi:curved DNA-binding protein